MRSGSRIAVAILILAMSALAASQTPAEVGFVYVGVCDGAGTQLNETDVYTSDGQFVSAFHGPSQGTCTTGLMFDTNNHLRVISAPFGTQSWPVFEFDSVGTLLSNKGPFSSPTSLTHDNQGNLYLANGSIVKIAPSGTMTTYTVAGNARYLTLATDQHTMFYTADNGDVRSYDLSTRTQGIDIAVDALARNIRTLPDNSLLLDTQGAVQRWIPSCPGCSYKQVDAYQIPANADTFALDPDGVSLWSINTYVDRTGKGRADVYRTNIKTGDPMGAFSLLPLDSGRYYSMSIGINGDSSVSSASASPTSLVYPKRTVGTTSSGKKITIANTGSVLIVVSNTTITGDFTVKHSTCVKGIAPGGSCAISVTFTPTQVGTRTGTLKVFDNVMGSPQVITLSGVGK